MIIPTPFFCTKLETFFINPDNSNVKPWEIENYPRKPKLDLITLSQIILSNKLFEGQCYIGYSYFTLRSFEMAKRDTWKFVEIKLVKEDKKALEKYAEQFKGNMVDMIEQLCSYQYKISISWVDKQNSYVVSVSGTDHSKDNDNRTLTSWSDDVIEAVEMALYKVEVICSGGNWDDHATEQSNWG